MRDLVAHLVVRENSPLSVGIVVPPLAGVTERATERTAERSRSRSWSTGSGRRGTRWARWPAVDKALNTAEYFVHHEDIRRAAPGWEPREARPPASRTRCGGSSGSPARDWSGRRACPVIARRSDTGVTTTLKAGADPVIVIGEPQELVLFVYGRRETHGLEFEGPERASRSCARLGWASEIGLGTDRRRPQLPRGGRCAD